MVPDYTMQGLLREQSEALERALSFSEDIAFRLREIQSFNKSIAECFNGSLAADLPSPSLPPSSRPPPPVRVPILDRLPVGRPPNEDISSPLCQPLLSYRTPDFPRVRKDQLGKKTLEAVDGTQSMGATDGTQSTGTIGKKVTQLFPSASCDTKRRVNDSLQRKVYNVEDLYHTAGYAQWVAKHDHFHTATLVVILVNTVWLGVDTDLNKNAMLSQAPIEFQVVDNLFCSFFTFELITRFVAFRRKISAFGDRWFCLDVGLVSLMIWETWVQPGMFAITGVSIGDSAIRSSSILRVFRIFRLARVARMARLLRAVPELLILVQSMAVAIRSVFATLVLLIIVIYIFALIFTQLLSGTPTGEGIFDTVPLSMHSLMLQVTCGFDSALVTALLHSGVLNYLVFLVYMLVANLTIMNMLIGVLVEVVADVSQQNKEEAFLVSMEEQITHMVNELDQDKSGSISRNEFNQLVESAEMISDLRDLGVDVVAFVEFTHFVLRDGDKSLSAIEFYDLVIQFRGSKAVTVKDVVDMRRFVSMELQHLENKLLEDLSDRPRLPEDVNSSGR